MSDLVVFAFGSSAVTFTYSLELWSGDNVFTPPS